MVDHVTGTRAVALPSYRAWIITSECVTSCRAAVNSSVCITNAVMTLRGAEERRRDQHGIGKTHSQNIGSTSQMP